MKSVNFGLKSGNILIINYPDINVGVKQNTEYQGFSPKPPPEKDFSEKTQS
jgi:hypothetical protein